MRKYEAMFIIKPDLSENDKKTLFTQINETVTKNKGNVLQAGIWSEKRKLYFPLKKYREGIYYLVNFSISDPTSIAQISQTYKLNENILRVLVIKAE